MAAARIPGRSHKAAGVIGWPVSAGRYRLAGVGWPFSAGRYRLAGVAGRYWLARMARASACTYPLLLIALPPSAPAHSIEVRETPAGLLHNYLQCRQVPQRHLGVQPDFTRPFSHQHVRPEVTETPSPPAPGGQLGDAPHHGALGRAFGAGVAELGIAERLDLRDSDRHTRTPRNIGEGSSNLARPTSAGPAPGRRPRQRVAGRPLRGPAGWPTPGCCARSSWCRRSDQ